MSFGSRAVFWLFMMFWFGFVTLGRERWRSHVLLKYISAYSEIKLPSRKLSFLAIVSYLLINFLTFEKNIINLTQILAGLQKCMIFNPMFFF